MAFAYYKNSILPKLLIMQSLALITFGVVGTSAYAQDDNPYLSTLTVLADNPDADILEIKLTIDALIDPETRSDDVRKRIESDVRYIEKLITPEMNDGDKIGLIQNYIYRPGEWNDFKPLSYDLDDPLGQSRTSRRLDAYLNTRKGNCVSMPVYFAILAEKIGLDVTLSTAPEHIFVKFTPDGGDIINLEATSGGYPARDEWYYSELPMTDKARENGVYMKALTHQEMIAVLGHDLTSDLLRDGDLENAILVAEKLIGYYPNFAPLYLTRGSAFYMLIELDCKKDEASLSDTQKYKCRYYLDQNIASFKVAEELGWQAPSE